MANSGFGFVGLVFFISLNIFNLSHIGTANSKINTLSDSVRNRDNYENVCFSVIDSLSKEFSIDNSNSYVAGNDSNSSKSEGRWSGIQLTVKAENETSYTLILYHSGMTTGLDPGYDIGLLSANPAFQLYTCFINNNGIKYMQQALPIDGCDTLVIPIGFDCAAGGEIKFSAVTEPLENYFFVLEDRKEGAFTNMSSENYTVTLPIGTNDTGRFYLHTMLSNPTGVSPTPDGEDKNGLEIWASGNRCFVKGLVGSHAVASFYNLQGRLVFETKLKEGYFSSYFLPDLKMGVYVIKVKDGHKITSKKIVF
jgi:hypothetical protein